MGFLGYLVRTSISQPLRSKIASMDRIDLGIWIAFIVWMIVVTPLIYNSFELETMDLDHWGEGEYLGMFALAGLFSLISGFLVGAATLVVVIGAFTLVEWVSTKYKEYQSETGRVSDPNPYRFKDMSDG